MTVESYVHYSTMVGFISWDGKWLVSGALQTSQYELGQLLPNTIVESIFEYIFF